MTTFPLLSTGAVQQYPYASAIVGRTRTLRFADGSEQRYQISASRRTWSISLRLLQESEKAGFLNFVQSVVRMQSTFQFTDPEDGTLYPTCRIVVAPVTDSADGVARTGIQFLVAEVTQ